jgi:hypothetical protein
VQGEKELLCFHLSPKRLSRVDMRSHVDRRPYSTPIAENITASTNSSFPLRFRFSPPPSNIDHSGSGSLGWGLAVSSCSKSHTNDDLPLPYSRPWRSELGHICCLDGYCDHEP